MVIAVGPTKCAVGACWPQADVAALVQWRTLFVACEVRDAQGRSTELRAAATEGRGGGTQDLLQVLRLPPALQDDL
jgi:hypothetical protein